MKKRVGWIVAFALVVSSIFCAAPLRADAGKMPDAYVTFIGSEFGEMSSEEYVLEVEAYGQEIVLPECTMFQNEGKRFVCWEANNRVYFPGDALIPEKDMEIQAIWMGTNEGGILYEDTFRGGISYCWSDDFEDDIDSVYDDSAFDGVDGWFDSWNTKRDGTGTKYAPGQHVTVKSGETLFLYAQWSEDLSQAWKVTLDFNDGDDDDFFVLGDNSFYYVKKGQSVPVSCFMGIEGLDFASWYDQPEGGNLLCMDGEEFTPSCDITLYAHWLPVSERHTVVVADTTEHGYAVVTDQIVCGAKASIYVSPDEGYVLETLSVKDAEGNLITVKRADEESYYFAMPDSNVTVTVSFAEKKKEIVNPFTDVNAEAYYYEPVLWALDNKVTAGITDTLFCPEKDCTRAQMVTFLWRASGCPVVNYAMSFTDVEEDAYYAEAVRWAVSEGITKGTSETTFSPNAIVSRAQTVAFLYRSAKAPAFVNMTANGPAPSPFVDVATDSYYYNAVLWALGQKITEGTSETTFSPNAPCTRGQIVTFLYRYKVEK